MSDNKRPSDKPESNINPREQSSKNGSDTRSSEMEIDDPSLMLSLTGPGGKNLETLAREVGVATGSRGHTIFLRGDKNKVGEAERVLKQLISIADKKQAFTEGDVTRTVQTLRSNPDSNLTELVGDVVLDAHKKSIVAKTVGQQRYVRQIHEHDVVFGVGPAGTGKTYLAMAMGVRAFLEKRVRRIVLTRPAVEAGEKLGFLPGDLAEKVNPYLRPLYDALHDMMDFDKAQALIQRGTIEVAPLAFMRGRTLSDAFVILDEAQNTTREQMKMFLTRIGNGSKAVVTGDLTQTDLPLHSKSGLQDAVTILSKTAGIGFSYFTDEDVVRHPLVARIIRAYDERERHDAVQKEKSKEAANP